MRGGELLANRYEVERSVGAGGMASVYLARDTLLERRVALKVLDDRHAGDPAYVERFRAEARAAARLQHPNVVGVIDRGEDGGREFIVYEYVEGESLKELVDRLGAFAPEQAVSVGLHVARALAHAHEQGLVHRDVKPQNVLLSEDGRARVTDFGIARAQEAPDRTESGTILGTGSYVAPEQAQGERVGPAADVYSLGVVLYELLAGEPPFRGSSFVETAVRHVHEQPPDLRERRPDVPPPLAGLVARCLAKDPAARPTAAQVAAELEALSRPAASEPPPPAAGGEAERTLVIARRSPARPGRRRLLVALATVALLAGAAAGVAFVLGGSDPRAGTPVELEAVATYDPPPGDGRERDETLAAATDGDPGTYWLTEGYEDFAALKAGVGIVLDAGGERELRSLTLRTDLPGFTAEVRRCATRACEPSEPLAPARRTARETTFQLGGTEARFLLLWLTALAHDSDGRERAHVNEVTARG